MGVEEKAQNVYTFDTFVSTHKSQLEAAGVPELYWHTLYYKLAKEVFDAGESFQIVDDGNKLSVIATKDIDPSDAENIFLIDHAWTFRPQDARRQLENVPGLLERMEGMMGSGGERVPSCSVGGGGEESDNDDEVVFEEQKKRLVSDDSGEKIDGSIPRQESIDANLCHGANEDEGVDRVMKEMWKRVQTYTVRYKQEVDEEGMPLWYAMDEFGSRIAHSDEPNCRVVPLFFAAQGIAYSVLFCLQKITEDEELVRDFASTVLLTQKPEWRKFLMLPWICADYSEENTEREKPEEKFYLSGRTKDELPSEEFQKTALSTRKNVGGKIRIFADSAQLLNNLDQVDFTLVDDYKEADVCWLMQHFHQYKDLCELNPQALVNQFPYEACLTVKDLLSATLMQSNRGQGPSWYQTCYNLNTELPQFVSCYQQRAKRGEDNTWIVKPWNLARGMDMHVTNDLGHIIRLIEAGPKIVCKYIENPVLFRRLDTGNMVKFDLRFIIFVNQLRPLKAYVYNNFWIRFAINQFTLTRLDDMETHFTVFNYGDKSKILQMECREFIDQIQSTHPQIKWDTVQEKINTVLRQLLEAVTSSDAPRGVSSNVQSRAMYGVDVMLKWEDKAKSDVGVSVLECNFMPDCERACVYYPDFADTVFETLFMDKIDPKKVTEL